MLEIEIKGNPVTKKNHGQIVICNGHPIMLPSKPYQEFEKHAKQFMPTLDSPIDYPINLKCFYYMQTKRKCDLTNLLQATCDILVKYKVLADDNYSIITSFDGSRVFYDKDNPRTFIQIEKI